VRTSRAALPALIQARGSIVNISSDNARRPAGAPLPYATAKGALNVFTRGLAEKVAPSGVRVNAVSPGVTRTFTVAGDGGFGSQLAASMGLDHDVVLANYPKQLGMLTDTLIEPSEIARAVLLLSSPTMPSAISQNWSIDAGSIKTVV